MRQEMKSKKCKYINRRNVNQDEDKNTKILTAQPKIFNLWRKNLSRYQNNILVHRLKFIASSKCNNIVYNSNIKNYTRTLRIYEFFLNKEANYSEENLFQKQSTFTPPQNRNKDLCFEWLKSWKNGGKILAQFSYYETKRVFKTKKCWNHCNLTYR